LGPPQLLPAGETCTEDRGLSELCAVVDAREGILADGLDRRRKQVRPYALHFLAHAVGLAALTREKNRRRGHHVKPTPTRVRGNRPCRDCPPIGGRRRPRSRSSGPTG